MKFLPLLILATCAFAQKQYNESRDRGQTPVQDPTQTLVRGRVGHQDPFPKGPLVISGMLVDGSCEDRSALNLRQRPEATPAPAPQQSNGGVSAAGVSVDA